MFQTPYLPEAAITYDPDRTPIAMINLGSQFLSPPFQKRLRLCQTNKLISVAVPPERFIPDDENDFIAAGLLLLQFHKPNGAPFLGTCQKKYPYRLK